MPNLKCYFILTLFSLTAAYFYEIHYPDTEVKRVYVSDKQQEWKKKFENYDPLMYSAPCIDVAVCDPDIGTEGFNPKFNEVDGEVDRRRSRSVLIKRAKHYDVENGYPLNPNGRTGLRGRGSLPRWGPNFLVSFMIQRGSRPVEFVVAEGNTTNALLALPEFFLDYPSKQSIAPQIVDAIREVLSTKYKKPYVDGIIERAVRHKYDFWADYYASQLNTDNAWIELLVYQFEDPKYEIIGMTDFKADNNKLGLRWKVIDPKTIRNQIKQILQQSKSSILDTIPGRLLLKHLGKKSSPLGYAFFLFRIALAITGLTVGTIALSLG